MLVFATAFSGKICMNQIKKKKLHLHSNMTAGNFIQNFMYLMFKKNGSYLQYVIGQNVFKHVFHQEFNSEYLYLSVHFYALLSFQTQHGNRTLITISLCDVTALRRVPASVVIRLKRGLFINI